ncbi:tape measure protein [Arthrobacter phage Timinator]|uniref:Tape measure protein n=3 Tax=Marthavirus barretlemon TaxID=2560300 RepID=A0A386KMI6_9CAUD|nr:tape measure protein [Arthrobacter phage Timinator]AYD86490.1 tape measure protein [Arthrobacter phage LeeroyJ]QJD53349.1 tape measure protein [Arthrobacter phage StevieBAY]
MADESRVVLTAQLRDEMSAPLDTLQSKVKATEKTITGSASRQASATKSSSTTILSALGSQNTATSRMTSMWSRLSSAASGGWNGAKSAVVSAGRKIIEASRKAGEESGSGMGEGFGSKLKGVLGGLAAAAGVASIGTAMNSAVESFSSLEDATAAAGTIYGDNINGIIDLSKKAGEQLGLNQAQVVEAAQTYGVYGKSAGLAGKDLETFSTDLITRAGDMASFFGKSPEQAIEAIGAAMRGEAEPIRAFGVMLDDATMRQKALEMGLVSSTKDALEPQAKVLAAQALIMEKSNIAAGDFTKTMDSTANIAKRLNVAQTNLSAKMGALLAPAFNAARLKALGAVNGISAFIDKINAAKDVAAAGGTSQDIAAALGFGPGTTKVIGEIIGSVRAFKAAVASPMDGVTSDGMAGGFERVGIVVGQARLGISAFFAALREGDVTSDGFVGVMERIGATLHTLSPAQWLGIAGGAGLLLASFGKFMPILSPLMSMFGGLSGMIGKLGGSLRFLLGPIGLIAGLLIYAYSTSEPFRNAINQLLGVLLNLGVTLMTSLMPVFMQLVTSVLPIVSQLFSSLVPILVSILTAVMPIVTTLISQLVPVFMQLIAAVLPPLMSLLTTLAPIFTMLISALAPLIPPVMEIVSLLLNLAMQVITPLMPIISLLANILSTVLGKAIEILMPIIKFLLDGFVDLVDFLKGPLGEVIKWVGGIFEGLGKIIGDVVKNVSDFFSNPLGGLQDMLGIPKENSGGGTYSGGGVAGYAGGGTVLGGYAPGRDTIPATLSRGESVLVPELTRAIGPDRIMAANRIASGGRPAGGGPALTSGYSNTSGGSTGGGNVKIVEKGAVQVTIVAQDGKISDADVQKIIDIMEEHFDDKDERDY